MQIPKGNIMKLSKCKVDTSFRAHADAALHETTAMTNLFFLLQVFLYVYFNKEKFLVFLVRPFVFHADMHPVYFFFLCFIKEYMPWPVTTLQ